MEGRMEHWSHEQQDGGQARDEGVTEKIFARGMGLAAVRSWLQQICQTGRRTRSPFMAAVNQPDGHTVFSLLSHRRDISDL